MRLPALCPTREAARVYVTRYIYGYSTRFVYLCTSIHSTSIAYGSLDCIHSNQTFLGTPTKNTVLLLFLQQHKEPQISSPDPTTNHHVDHHLCNR